MNHPRGFTLIEVVVAMAILGIGLALLLELHSGSLRLARVSDEYTKALHYARIKMEEVALRPYSVEGREEGEFDGPYRWRVDVKKVDLLPPTIETDFKPPVELFAIKISIFWNSGIRERSTVLETYRMVIPEDEEKRG